MDTPGGDDIKSFERRQVEWVSSYELPTLRWRILLTLMGISIAISIFIWYRDPRTAEASLGESLWMHPICALVTITFGVLLILGIGNSAIAQQIITKRIRNQLNDYYLSCDNKGRMIVKQCPNDSNQT